ncbi:MAG: DUF6058 family natural product biosynthesis protein [Pseudomonadota bacterium]
MLPDYLYENFYTASQLQAASETSAADLQGWQAAACMPMPSYSLQMDLHCLSYFGEHRDSGRLDFYAKGYVQWLQFLRTLPQSGLPEQQAGTAFRQRYLARSLMLFEQGLWPRKFRSQDGKPDFTVLDQHIGREWVSFLKGTYGLCTKSGLPEDIADKELATLVIDEITERQAKPALSASEEADLIMALRLLDRAAALFAPHERARSSRQRCIVAVAGKYGLAW